MDSASSTLFQDRLLTCLDCGGEFIFTAGEQLFFHDKQFKNDPKRCKPCKSRRAGASAKPGSGPAAAGISRTETRTECSECGIETTVPFKPTQGRPVLCRQCFQLKAAKPAAAVELPAIAPPPSPFMDPTVSALTQASVSAEGVGLTQEAAVLAAVSMTTALPNSSVATVADLASITGVASHGATSVSPAGGLTDAAIQSLDSLQA
ncbi:CxxC-x17-CxxC domain-containing protein [Granulicella rosea]|uniref:CxxC-x17-CxxC domain-containing protein n=1 Tax=Granulicella rosea TaxID=474952 RepID=A0A239DDU5_9BACT|nr:zinc-ribbon domain containing protein [Granulicella rosea]SNS30477.1 CxxC-x17-CxxC domain-containing protein [Granulicella rosea]